MKKRPARLTADPAMRTRRRGREEPQGGGNHDEDAEPGDLAGGSAEGVGGDSEAEPARWRRSVWRLQGAQAAVEAEDDGEEAEDVRHEGGREHEVERGEDEGEGAEGGIALGDPARTRVRCRTKARTWREERAQAHGSEGEAEEFDEGGAEVELPGEHGCRPAVIDDVAGGGEGLRHQDVGAVVGDAHVGEGVADEFAEEHAGRRRERGSGTCG